MEAPEKLYILFNHPHTVDYAKLNKRRHEEEVEYTRTDAFIEKALAYLHDKFYFNNVFYGIVSTDFNAMEEMYEDFREYLKK